MKINAYVNAKEFNRNPSNCECECDKSCNIGEYIDYKNCKCRKILVDKLVEECNENIDEKELNPNKMIYNSTLNDYKKIVECSSGTIHIILFVIFLIVSKSISSAFTCFHMYLKRKYMETRIYWIQFCWTHKWGILSKLILEIVHITFLMTWSILKTLV